MKFTVTRDTAIQEVVVVDIGITEEQYNANQDEALKDAYQEGMSLILTKDPSVDVNEDILWAKVFAGESESGFAGVEPCLHIDL